ncbi:adhesion G-protein coupled receptor G7 [Echinops telfairi]|uniref:Adhesion G-protein coupled receptor G7 n=1 Tax=Echinops telfairi TaxID=9371 RepID=A0ABM0IS57_ECHTE|nr:adhesion G-protein coupled receptor G7 [Echinops telfairi]
MVSCRICGLRELVAIACGLLTTIVLGLGIWRSVVWLQRGNSTSPSTTPTEFCRNGGTWENGRCICPDEWKGLRCTHVNFCNDSSYQNFTFRKIPAGRYGSSIELCEKNTPNAGSPKATRLCSLTEDGEIVLQDANIGNCSESLETLENKIENISKLSDNISVEAQILTSDANKLTADNITAAANVVGQLFNESRKATVEAKKTAVTTVSQLLDASENVFQQAAVLDENNTFKTLIEQMETYSLTLDSKPVVEPNVAVHSVTLPPAGTEGSSNVLFSVLKGSSNSLTDGSTVINTDVDTLNPSEQTELQILVNTKQKNIDKCGFVVYQNNKLFQSKTFTTASNFSQRIISSKTNGVKREQDVSVEMIFNPKYNQTEFQLHSYACVFWNLSKNDWDTYGCKKTQNFDGFLHCSCNHTTNFAVLMSFQRKYNYPDSLNVLSNIGCALSIAGLALTIAFQVATRKGRKTSVTWVLVNLCTSMLIFNLLFVFGIENSNKNIQMSDQDIKNSDSANEMLSGDTVAISNPTCTAIAALLHYFLLVTFAWTALSSAQLYFLLIWTMKPLPQHFILYISLIGWGVPAIVVGLTLGIIYSQNKDGFQWELKYRQEEICWLAGPEGTDVKNSPLLWSFLLPVTIVLLSNVTVFVIVAVRVLWKNNQNLTSTKKVSSMKKIVSTLSVAVVFGITWLLAYFMLIGNEELRLVFTWVFCLFNTTQGLQIFIFYTIRTKIFQSEASKVLKSLSSSAERVKSLPSVTPLRLRLRVYNMIRSLPALNERFRVLEQPVYTEEMLISQGDEASVRE